MPRQEELNFYYTAVAGPPQGVEVGHVSKEEEANGACKDPQDHIRKRGQSLTKTRGQG